ncbi:MAG: hypothetical protein ACR2G6_01145 [Gemmatimonadaceae bacterium]
MERVAERRGEHDEPDEILDDFFVLWRAYETTFEGSGGTLLKRAQEATVMTINRSIRDFPAVLRFAGNFEKQFGDRINPQYIESWFPSYEEEKKIHPATMIAGSLKHLRPALRQPSLWIESHSKDFATLIYYLRNAIFHGSFGTSKLVESPRAFAGIREAMEEIVARRL